MSLHTQAKRHEQVDGFFSSPSTQALEDVSLGRFLDYDQERARPSSAAPLEELEERLLLVKQVQNHVFGTLHRNATSDTLEKRQFTAFQLSVMMMMPLDNLRTLKPTLAGFKDFEQLVSIFVQRTPPDQPGTSASSSKRTKSGTVDTPAARRSTKRKRPAQGADDNNDPTEVASVQRSVAEAKKCQQRDSDACKLNLTSNPRKCHIVPFAANSTTAMVKRGKSFFGIKCAGITPEKDAVNSMIWLEFHWMSLRVPQDPGRKISIDLPADGPSEARQFVKGPGVYYGDAASVNTDPLDLGLVMDSIAPSGRPLLSGHKFQITMTTDDAAKMKGMVDFQWACVNIANMSGAAGWPGFTDDDDDGDDAFADLRVSTWVEETTLASLTEMPGTPAWAPTPQSARMRLARDSTPRSYPAAI